MGHAAEREGEFVRMDCDILMSKLKTIFAYRDLVDRLEPVDGFLLEIQAYTLMMMANEGPGAGVIVEIGSYMGRSTCCLALGSKSASREKVYAIDHFRGSEEHQEGQDCETIVLMETGTTYPQFRQNIKRLGVEDYVNVIKKSSGEAIEGWELPIRLLFIDGDHSYAVSKQDFELWSPFVVPGGIIIFHDIGCAAGVTQYYNELMADTQAYQEVFGINGMNVVEKRVTAPAG